MSLSKTSSTLANTVRLGDLKHYISIARVDHWFKNIFVLPGIFLGYFFYPQQLSSFSLLHLLLCLFATCLVASSNYVINEILDAPTDIHHPLKRYRPIPSGKVYLPLAYAEWILLAVLGLGLAFSLSTQLGFACSALWVMGLLYNVPPIRLKDVTFCDVLSESINNPLRLLIGWYATGLGSLPPISIVLAYWMFGAFLMAVKRFGEYRGIGDALSAGAYRNTFNYYNEERLILSIIFYVALFAMFAAVFMTRYRLELLFVSPLLALSLSYYLHLGFKPNSPVQQPETLYKQPLLCAAALLNVAATGFFLFFDVPMLEPLFSPWHSRPAH